MLPTPEKGTTTKVLLAVGGMGVAIHLIFVRCIAHWSYQPPADRSFVNSFPVNAALGLLGGLLYALFLRWPVTESVRARRSSVSVLLKGGLWGMLATFAAFQGFFLGAACLLTLKGKAVVPDVSLTTAFLLSIMEIETYGLIEVSYLLIPAFACGVLVTAVVARSFFQPTRVAHP